VNSIAVEIKTAEGELIEVVGLVLATTADPAELRAAVEELAESLAASTGAEPVIQETLHETFRPTVAIGGGVGGSISGIATQVVEYVVHITGGNPITAATAGVLGNATWDAIKMLAKRFGAKPVPADLTQLIELDVQRIAVKGLAEKYAVDENDLEPVSSSFDALRCTLVFRGSDGSTYIVNVGGETGLMTGTQRIWPKES
jgi:hypothetical protein